MKRALLVVALVPVVAATAVAGIISAPSKVRPCVQEFSRGFTGGPTHLTVASDGSIWVAEGQNDKIAHFVLKTKTATEYKLPKGTEPHDLVQGPDGKFWFTGFNGKIGSFEPKTGKVKIYWSKSKLSQPHLWWAPDGKLYWGDRANGRLYRFDPKTTRITSSRYNLPKNNGIHSFTELPDGTTWWSLQLSDQIAHFDAKKQRFDEFIKLPKGSGPHWVTYVPSDHSVWVALQYSSQLARVNLDTKHVTLFAMPVDPVTQKELSSGPARAFTFVVEDAQHQALWLADLSGGELIRFDLKTHKVTRVGCGITQPSATITIANDHAGNLWVTEAPPGGGAGRLGRVER